MLPDGPDVGSEYDVQETKYLYGARTSRGDGLNSNDVLIAVRYPDKSTGQASSSEQETFTTNALGQTLTKADRNGNVHTFSYDIVGRLTGDAVTTLGDGVDGAVRRIQTTYNTQGLPEKITSYDAATSGSVVNEVQRGYNGLGQLTTEWQAHDGAVNTSTSPKVQYGYATVENGSRLTLLTYPNGRELTYNYASGLDSTIGRLSSISDGVETLEEYAYLGLSGVIMRLHPENGVDLTYVGTPGDAGDQYAGLDRFGRIIDQNWHDGTSSVDRYTYTYDRNSNRTSKDNALHSAFDEDYTYDTLNRLTGTNRDSTAYQNWNLDALGNSNSVTTNSVTETRTHNSQNQLTGMGENELAFDANGNTTTDQQGRTLIYDAWNRMVEAKDGESSLIRYEYDGLARRIEEGSTDQYFSAAWQVLEERVSGDTTASYAWSPVYVDAMIARDRNTTGDDTVLEERLYALQDANFNVTAIADTSGDVVERYLFDPYGKRTILDPNFSADGDNVSDFAFLHGHQGGKYDGVLTNQMLFRHRVYDVEAMRWMRQDPAGYVDGLSMYTGYIANPVSHRDPRGQRISFLSDGSVDGNALTTAELAALLAGLQEANKTIRITYITIDDNGHRWKSQGELNGCTDCPWTHRNLDEGLPKLNWAFELAELEKERSEAMLASIDALAQAMKDVGNTLASLNPLNTAGSILTGEHADGTEMTAGEWGADVATASLPGGKVAAGVAASIALKKLEKFLARLAKVHHAKKCDGVIYVIGRQPDTAIAKNWPGHEILDLPLGTWTIKKNDEWIQNIVKNKSYVYVGSAWTKENMWDLVNNRETVFGREVRQLLDAGYTHVGDYLVPPGK